MPSGSFKAGLLMALAAGLACGGGDGGGPNRLLVVVPDSLGLTDCGTAQLVVELQDADGDPVPGATYAFNSSASGVVTVTGAGAVTATGPGNATIVVSSGGAITNVPVTVQAVAPVLEAPPDSMVLWPGVSDTVVAGLVDCRGQAIAPAVFSSPDTAVVAVAGGIFSGRGFGVVSVGWTAGAANGQVAVQVIGRTLGADVTSTPLGGTPYGVAVTAGGRVLVTQLSANTLATGQLPATTLAGGAIGVGLQPPHVTVNAAGTRAYTTNQAGASVSVVNLQTNAATGTIPLASDGFNLGAMRDGQVLVTTASGMTYALDSLGAKLDSFTVGPVSNGVAEHPTSPLAYLSARDGPTVTVYNYQTHTAVDTFVTGGMPQRMAVSPDGARLYIANETLGLDIWNTTTGQRIQSVAMPAYGLALSPDGSQLVVTSAAGTVRLVNTTSLGVTVLTFGLITRNAAYEANGRTAVVTDEGGVVHYIR